MGSSICAGILLAWLHKFHKDNYLKNLEENPPIVKDLRSNITVYRKNIERKNSLAPSKNIALFCENN